MSQPLRPSPVDCVPSRNTLHNFLLNTGRVRTKVTDPDLDRLAAVVTVSGTAPPRWNTPDGKRPTQAYIDALQHPQKVDGYWPVQPSIYTPYVLTIQRVVRGSGDALPSPTNVTAFLEGGSLGQDRIVACETTAGYFEKSYAPSIGHTYLVFLWRELTHEDGVGQEPIRQPTIGNMYFYDPATDVVQTLDGPVKLSDALQGIPPG